MGCAPRTPWEQVAPTRPDAEWRASQTGDQDIDEALQALAFGNTNPPKVLGQGVELAVAAAPKVDPTREYGLPELIDIAQRSNPGTRVAWERARQAAMAIGLVEGAYQPMLAASLVAGYERAVFPIQQVPGVIDSTYFSAQTLDVVPSLQLTWLVYDCGRREAARDMAQAKALAADAAFSQEHRTVGYAVTVAYHAFLTSRERVATARVAALAATEMEREVRAGVDNGLATETQLLAAIRSRVQAEWGVEVAMALEATTRIDLIEAVGFAPANDLLVARDEMPLDDHGTAALAQDVEDYVTRAIEQRDDMKVAVAGYRSSQAAVRLARADFKPTVTAGGNVGIPYESFDVASVGWESTTQPWYGAFVGVSIPILDGEMRETKLQIALAGLSASSAEIAASRNRATREVWKAYAGLSTALRQRAVVQALVAASERNHQQSLAAFKNGLATFVEADEARRGLADAQLVEQESRAAVRVALATLALSVGEDSRHQ